MARIARQKSSTGIYHIMMRGINRQNIFADDEDRERFLLYLRGATSFTSNVSGCAAGKYEIYAYALMGNHFHIFMRVVSGELGEFVKKIASSYVMFYNKKYDREGHLFQARFKSEPCEDNDYFCTLMVYVHRNPIKHGFAKSLEEYPFTSWGEYFGTVPASSKICNTDYVLNLMTLEELNAKLNETLPDNLKCVETEQFRNQITDTVLIKYARDKYHIDNPSEIKGMCKEERDIILRDLRDYGGVIRQISRLTGMDKMTIQKVTARK